MSDLEIIQRVMELKWVGGGKVNIPFPNPFKFSFLINKTCNSNMYFHNVVAASFNTYSLR